MAADIVNITVTELEPEVVTMAITEVNGKDGHTPVKGVDYFDGNPGRTPVKGVDYFDGTNGTNGKDGFTETYSSLLNKLGYATDASPGALSAADHALFKNKQPAGAYILNTSIARGTKVYHSQGSGDTIGDWRTYSDANGFYTQYCTVGSATVGNGTWVTKHTITI